MNREIKFRAWDGKQMSSPVSIQRLCQGQPLEDIQKYVWLEWTGLKDKNGKEIYEGDVVKQIGWYKDRLKDWVGVVEWLRFGFGVKSNSEQYSLRFAGDNEDDNIQWEVIGNIYESLELLRPQEEA